MRRQAPPTRRMHTMRRLLVIAFVLAVAVSATLLSGVAREGGEAQAGPGIALRTGSLEAGLASGETAGLVRDLQARLRDDPADGRSWTLLGLGYEQLARESGDAAWYGKADGALRRALELDRNDQTAVVGLGSLALSRHRFRDALVLGRRAQALAPADAHSYGVIGDALVELGRYDAAFRSFRRMLDLKPTSAAYARWSYARELVGDRAGAKRWMRLAQDAAVGRREAFAWASVQLGHLYWGAGEVHAAERQYRIALVVFPGYVYSLEALARVAAARGDLRVAISLQRRAVDTIPLPQFVTQLGDLYRRAGRLDDARAQYATVAAIERLQRANGVATDLESALFAADRGRPSVALARRARALRPSVDGDDVLAWTLARAGRCGEALPWSRRSLRLGTQDALKFFHRAWIEDCLGRRAESRLWAGRALRLNPNLSLLWTATAKRLAR
jgi:tetratricopeptide (TPR) repeat protein